MCAQRRSNDTQHTLHQNTNQTSRPPDQPTRTRIYYHSHRFSATAAILIAWIIHHALLVSRRCRLCRLTGSRRLNFRQNENVQTFHRPHAFDCLHIYIYLEHRIFISRVCIAGRTALFTCNNNNNSIIVVNVGLLPQRNSTFAPYAMGHMHSALRINQTEKKKHPTFNAE